MTERTMTLTLTEHAVLVQRVENLARELAACRAQREALQRQLTLTLAQLPKREETEEGLL